MGATWEADPQDMGSGRAVEAAQLAEEGLFGMGLQASEGALASMPPIVP